MNSIDKLREAAKLLGVMDMRPSLYEIADEIEAEIERVEIEWASFVRERTCRMEREPGSDRLWWCSNCESYHEHASDYPWEHCPRCGAKVRKR